MENFFYEDVFCSDLDDLLNQLNEEASDLNDDWTCRVELTTLEPMFTLNADNLAEMLYNNKEERYSEDAPQDEVIIKALKECIDFEKLNSKIPKLYYPNNKFVTITKKDLIEYSE